MEQGTAIQNPGLQSPHGPHLFPAMCPSLSLKTQVAPSLQHVTLSASNLISLPHVLDFPAPAHHGVQIDPAIKGGSREH